MKRIVLNSQSVAQEVGESCSENETFATLVTLNDGISKYGSPEVHGFAQGHTFVEGMRIISLIG